MEQFLQNSDLLTLAAYFATGGGSVWLIKWLFGRGYFKAATSNLKMVIGAALTSGLGVGAGILLVYLGDNPIPVSVNDWIAAVWPAIASAYFSSQALYVWLKSRNPEFGKAK